MTILDIIGLKVVAIKCWAEPRELKKKKPKIPAEYIFFEDGGF